MNRKYTLFFVRISIFLIFLVIIGALAFGFGKELNTWLLDKKYFFFIWRLFLYSSITFFWLKKLKPKIINESNRSQVKRIEFLIVTLFSLIEVSILL